MPFSQQAALNALSVDMAKAVFMGSFEDKPVRISFTNKPFNVSGLKILPAELGQQTAFGISFTGV